MTPRIDDAHYARLELLARFALAMFDEHRNGGDVGDIDGGEAQERAEEFGLIEPRRMTEACCDLCACADANYGDSEWTCYFPAPWIKQVREELTDG